MHSVKSNRMNGLKLFVSLSVLHSILYCINAQEVNECNSIPCKYGGTCSDLVNAFTCACTNGYSGTNCQVASLGSSCLQYGTICADPKASCQTNGQGGSTCQCTSLYYDSDGANNIGGTCTSKVGLAQNCPRPNACLTSNSECVGGICRCTDNFYDTNTANTNGGSCVSRRNLGGSCKSDTNTKQCIDPNASCQGSSYSCSCDARYHPYENKCFSNVPLDGQCKGNVDDECSDPNAECINSKCTCSVGFYQSKSNSQSNCRDVTELRVTGITFSSVKTTEFTVSWTLSARSSYVSGYDVEWQSGGKFVGASSPQRVSGLTPGKVYELKVISKDTATQPGVTRRTYTSKLQATKPSIPGAVTSSGNDLDSSDGNILIRLTPGNGVATKYAIKLFDGEVQKGSKEISSLSSLFSGVLNGHRYSVVITARSEQFNGNYLWSADRVSQIKTKVQVPEAPRNGVCKSPTDNSITLDWDAPTLPNGDLVRYYIDVKNSNNKLIFRDVTASTATNKVVGNLQPGTSYLFWLYTENEQYISTSYEQVLSACKTKAKLSDPPTNLRLTTITSRGFDISWEKPNNTYSEENYGYVLQIKDNEDVCWTEVIYRCSDCIGLFILSNLSGLCYSTNREQIDKSKMELVNKFIYRATLHPDIAYTVSVSAISDAGRGHQATMIQKTNEEAPQKPYIVHVEVKNATAFHVTWRIDGPRPGKTDFLITFLAEAPALTKNISIRGFDVREYTAVGLQENWNYSVSVTASTTIGSRKSEVTNQYRTKAAAPGKVAEFNINYHPGGDYTRMKISWKIPTVLERNSIITSYKFEFIESGIVTTTKNFNQEAAKGYVYTVTFDVNAINEDGMEGEKHSVVIEAPAGVPINIEETKNISIIPTDKVKNVGETKITVSLVHEFFTEAKYGQIRGTGLIICSKKDCGPKSTVKTLTDFDKMKNWKEDKEAYRSTSETWLPVMMQNNAAQSRRTRAVTYIEYTIGSDNCPDLTSGQYCNGPLEPGKSYYIFAVSCSNGGCLVTKSNGPFITKTVQVTEELLRNCSMQSVVIGVVLGLIILILVVYAGYTTITIRRIRNKDELNSFNSNKKRHISQTYVNETFGTGLSGVFNEANVQHPGIAEGYTDTEYTTLDNRSREEKTTYDILRN